MILKDLHLDDLTEAQVAETIRRLALAVSPEAPWPSLEHLYTSPDLWNLPASPLQRAICRIAEGLPVAPHPAYGEITQGRPHELAVLSGIRVGKSLFAGAAAVHASQTCDVSALGPGEIPRVSIVSLSKDLAEVIYSHIVGRIAASPVLRSLLLDEPGAGSVLLRHPTGRPVEIRVVAGSRAGSSLVARWSAGCIFDEFPRMIGGTDGVINWDHSRRAVLERMLPGAQLLHIGSPWAPFGPAFKMVTDHHGAPSSGLVVVKAPAWDMHPGYWTRERCDEARRHDPDVYQTDVAAEFATAEDALFSLTNLDRATRTLPLEVLPEVGASYAAAMDPATRGNGWTVAIATRRGRRLIVVAAREWRGSRLVPLDPEKTLAEIRDFLAPYSVKHVETDQWAADALKALAKRHGLHLIERAATGEELVDRYKAFRIRLDANEIELPPEAQLQADLRRVQKRVTAGGTAIHLPHTSDGRHCDYAPSVMLVLNHYLRDFRPEAAHPESDAARQVEADLMKLQRMKAQKKEEKQGYWQRSDARRGARPKGW